MLSHSVLLTVAYDGRPFSGWAPQEGARTVAGELLGAIRAMDPRVGEVRGASRTDAGVHARGQLAAFDPTRTIAPKGWALGLSAHLPSEITIRHAALVPAGSEPRFSAKRKRYRYLILRDPLRDPFWEGRALRFSHQLDIHKMRAEAASLVGEHDFAGFRSSSDERVNTIRTIEQVRVEHLDGDSRVLAVDVVGSGFMHNMVRIIVGTLLDVARGRLAEGTIDKAIASGARAHLGMTAPAHGLYLETIEHTLALESPWPYHELP
ncbi:MAG TPA: tRNA pseudouridine(38-40) synthase TruA [Polyangiaceae bacterium]|nr:tRNA pseudouridine(38-40) synthase TruA [Polyangiaceae bacterium]